VSIVKKAGVVGLGIMGAAVAVNLMKRGFTVIGYDVAPECIQAFAAAGGVVAGTPREVAEQADVVITLLPGVDILHAVLVGPDGLVQAGNRQLVVADCGTFDLAGKDRCLQAVQASGTTLLDCTISGTGAQALAADLVVYASGARDGYEKCSPVFAAFSRENRYVGEFGNGSKVKYIANLLVAIHNAAAAEAMVLAQRAGLDLQAVLELVKSGAGNSRMLELRGPLMVEGVYDRNVASRMELWQKDMVVIGGFAKDLHCPVPLFAQAAQLYNAAIGQGHGKEDMAAICAVLESMAGIRRGK
jgi:putative dehydrogenase